MRVAGLALLWAVAAAAAPALGQTSDTAAATPAVGAKPAPMNVRTTGDLVALCNTPATDPSYPNAIGLCVGYGSGVLDYHLADTFRQRRARKVCIPQPPPTRGEAREKFIVWAQAHPDDMQEPAVYGVMRFLIAAYPCGK